jgi:hypothetical protein
MHKREDAPEIKFPEDVVIHMDNPNTTSLVTASTSTVATRKQYAMLGKYACKEANIILYNFFNSANTSICQAINKYLHEYSRYLLDNAGVLQFQKNNIIFSQHKYLKLELMLFSTFMMIVTNLVENTSQFYKNQTNNSSGIPFICCP